MCARHVYRYIHIYLWSASIIHFVTPVTLPPCRLNSRPPRPSPVMKPGCRLESGATSSSESGRRSGSWRREGGCWAVARGGAHAVRGAVMFLGKCSRNGAASSGETNAPRKAEASAMREVAPGQAMQACVAHGSLSDWGTKCRLYLMIGFVLVTT